MIFETNYYLIITPYASSTYLANRNIFFLCLESLRSIGISKQKGHLFFNATNNDMLKRKIELTCPEIVALPHKARMHMHTCWNHTCKLSNESQQVNIT